jgi:hypothetical protein
MIRCWAPRLMVAIGAVLLWTAGMSETRSHGVFIRVEGTQQGVVKPGAVIERTFRVWNLTAMPVRYSAMIGCGCATLDASDGMLRPFGSKALRLRVDTRGQRPGPASRAIQFLYTAGPKTWQEVVALKYEVQAVSNTSLVNIR